MGSSVVRHIDLYLLVLLILCIHIQVLSAQSFVEHASHSQEAVRTAKCFGFPEREAGESVAVSRLKRLCLMREAPSI